MNRSNIWTTVCLSLALASLAMPASANADDDEKQNVSAAFGRGLNTNQAGNLVNHVILPNEIRVNHDGVVNFLVAGFHQLIVYKPGTRPEDILVPAAGTFIDDNNNLFYRGINPAGGPLATPATASPHNGSNRVEGVSFPAEEGRNRTTGALLSEAAEPGTYLVICNVRGHFLDGMYAFIEVKGDKDKDEDEDEK